VNELAHEHGHADHPHVDTNPWPPVGALGIVMMALGLAFSFTYAAQGRLVLILGAILTIVGTVGWWRDLIHEARTGTLMTAHAASDAHKPLTDLKLGMILFIASEVMFFAAFFGFYFYTRSGSTLWPPAGSEPIAENLMLPIALTLILLTSGMTYTYAEASLMKDDRRGLVTGLLLTVLLGVVFIGGQAYEWSHSHLAFTSGLLGNAFYMLTGFHGMHVIVGAIFILVNLVRATRGHFSKADHFALQGAGWYWHFVDVVWILLFFSLYVF